jgi:predicted Rossmann fold flavoprotein
MHYDAIIIGGGAAGLFCAIEAGKRGRKILVIERNAQTGRKILISGGGRCNFTNLNVAPENFVSQNPHFCKSALARYTPQDFMDLVKRHKIAFYEKKLGQLFCRESARQIVDMLLEECRKALVEIRTACSVESVEKNDDFEIKTDQGIFRAEKLVVATGGLSFAKVGATDLGYRVARQFGLKIVQTRPSLVPLVFNGENFRDLAGVSIESELSTNGANFRENILFTHRGLSGPAVLQISNYWKKDEPVRICLRPEIDWAAELSSNRGSGKRLDNFLAGYLPAKFAARIVSDSGWIRPMNQMNESDLKTIASALSRWAVEFKDTEGYDKAEVTIGGVSTDELSSKTMESKKAAGLFLIGEVVDVTGWLGGYNFQWAWSSGFAAGKSI